MELYPLMVHKCGCNNLDGIFLRERDLSMLILVMEMEIKSLDTLKLEMALPLEPFMDVDIWPLNGRDLKLII